ncbi:phosphatase PAP2 family protein [Candidatus Nomurabacteria bacterium]|nr:phosphatase PAP2 family protein [Candidatus Nomurabacteria bacterium]
MNNKIFFFFYNLAYQSQVFDAVVVFFALYFPYLVAISVLVFLLYLNKKKEILLTFFSAGLAYVFAYIFKHLFSTSRPFDAFPQVHSLVVETGYSFPSGHATFFMALAVAIFFYHKKAGYVFMFFALLIGLARVIAGVHFPVDILGGFVLGGLVSCLVAR